MEKSNLSYSQILEQEIEEWKKFRRALRKQDQQVFDQLVEKQGVTWKPEIAPQGRGHSKRF